MRVFDDRIRSSITISRSLRMRLILVASVFLMCSITNTVLAQTARLDSLKQVYPTLAGSDKIRCELDIAASFGLVNLDSAMSWVDLVLTTPNLDSILWLHASRKKARILVEAGQRNKAMQMVNDLIPVAQRLGDVEHYYLLRNSLAVSYLEDNRYSDALSILYDNLLYYKKTDNTQDYRITLGNIGLTNYKMKHFSRAIEYYNASLRLRPNDHAVVDPPYINIMLAHAYSGQLDSSYLYQEIAFRDRRFQGQPRECVYLNGYGIVLFLDNKLAESKVQFEKAAAIAIKHNWRRIEADCYLYLAQIAIAQSDYGLAAHYLDMCIERSDLLPLVKLSAYQVQRELLERMGATVHLVESQRQLIQIQHRLQSNEALRGVALAQSKFSHENYHAILDTLRESSEVRSKIERQQQIIYYAVIGVALVMIFLLAALVKYFMVLKHHRALLRSQILMRGNEISDVQSRLDNLDALFHRREFRRRSIPYFSVRLGKL